MPLKVSRQDRKLFLGLAAIFGVLVLGAAFFASKAGSKSEMPTTYSSGSEGAKAIYLLLQESGYHVIRWEQKLSELPAPYERTLILADPQEAPTKEDKRRLQAFLEGGGHVIATGMFAPIYLPHGAFDPDFIEGMVWKKMRALSPSSITRAAPEITMAPQAHWSRPGSVVPLYGDGSLVRVVKYDVGKGQVIWWAAATPLTNAGLREAGNLDFVLACLGDPSREILWDEYIHGYRHTLGSTIAHSPVIWLVAQFGLLACAVLLTFSRRSGPMFPPVADVRLSPLEFVTTLGDLYQRAGAASVAVDINYQRFRYWLTRRFGLLANASVDDLSQAVRQRSAVTDEGFASILRECEGARYDSDLSPQRALQLVQKLHDYADKLKLFPGPRGTQGESDGSGPKTGAAHS
jgi:Domain of unknown function (DUF4350)